MGSLGKDSHSAPSPTATPDHDGLARWILVAALCAGVVRPALLAAHVRPLQLLPPRPRSPLPADLGHGQHRQLDIRLRPGRPARTRLGDHRKLEVCSWKNKEELWNIWRIQR